jgi:hypothetical protein
MFEVSIGTMFLAITTNTVITVLIGSFWYSLKGFGKTWAM